jgi:hypothetical protein
VRELVEPIVEHVNAEHSRYEQIKKFTILDATSRWPTTRSRRR